MISQTVKSTSIPLVAVLSDKLRRDICLGVLTPGTRLNIEALKREHGISHPSVREALAQLVGEGYVVSGANKGFAVAETSLDEQRDSTLVRAELEAMAFEWSIKNGTTDWRAHIVACHYGLTQVEKEMIDDPVSHALEWDNRNRAFHFALIANCDSPKLLAIIGDLHDHSQRYRLAAHSNRAAVVDRERWVAGSSGEHSALKDAALDGDIESGLKILKKHIIKAIDEMPNTLSVLADQNTIAKAKTLSV